MALRGLLHRDGHFRTGSIPAVCNRLFDFKSLSEPPRIPAMPSVDRANGALCHNRTKTPKLLRASRV